MPLSFAIPLALIIGRTEGLRAAVSELLDHCARAAFFHSLADACASDLEPDVCLVLQHWPDEYPPRQIARLLERFPLTRLIVCQGEWCASYGRTHSHWPAAVCVDAARVASRIRAEIDVVHGRRPPLPWTAGLDELFGFDQAAEHRAPSAAPRPLNS